MRGLFTSHVPFFNPIKVADEKDPIDQEPNDEENEVELPLEESSEDKDDDRKTEIEESPVEDLDEGDVDEPGEDLEVKKSWQLKIGKVLEGKGKKKSLITKATTSMPSIPQSRRSRCGFNYLT